MKTISEKTKLETEIAFLKSKQAEDFLILKEQYHITIDSYKPFNLIKSVSREFMANPDLKTNLINGAIGFGTNYISKNVLNQDSINPIKRVLGRVLKFAWNNYIGKNRRKSSDIG